jgi:5-methylcytosine-specific restriction endonuclease McrA
MTEYDPGITLPPKQCHGCRKTYERTPEFWYRNKSNTDGLEYSCRQCSLAGTKRYQRSNPDKVHARNRAPRKRNIIKARERQRRYYARHKNRVHEKGRLYHIAHPDKALKRNQRWRLLNPEAARAARQRRYARLRGLPHDLTTAQYAETLAYYNHACAYCGIPQCKLGHTLHREHILPLSRGGGYIRDNIVPACKPCNDHKHDKTPEEAGMKLLKPWPIPQSTEAH